MRKVFLILLAASLLVTFAGCGTPNTTDTPATTQAPTPAATTPETQPTPRLGTEDSYWQATTWKSSDEAESPTPQPMDASQWSIDLLIRADGTARLRDIREEVCLMDDSHLQLTWTAEDDGHYLFYSSLTYLPVLDVVYDGSGLAATYRDLQLTLEAAPLPKTAGELYAPAQLAGVWLMVSGETEGYEWEAMPGELSSIIFRVASETGPLFLAADLESRDHYGDTNIPPLRDQAVTLLQEPLYEGSENESWSVRIGPESPVDANNAPLSTEYHATLLSHNILQLQRYYTLDGYRAVSYQTFVRFPDLVSWCDAEYLNLLQSTWTCTGYTDFDRQPLPMPTELEDLEVFLGEGDCCTVSFGDGTVAEGTWHLKDGGVILLMSDEETEKEFWLGGAAGQYALETEDTFRETYQMCLYYKGGILQLELSSYG